MTSTASATQISYEASVWLEGDNYVSHAWPLDVVSCGDSEEHALRMLEEAVQLFIETTRDMGTLDLILEESGYVLKGDTLVPPEVRRTRTAIRLSH